jgi:hypothetical protein
MTIVAMNRRILPSRLVKRLKLSQKGFIVKTQNKLIKKKNKALKEEKQKNKKNEPMDVDPSNLAPVSQMDVVERFSQMDID